MLGIRGIKGGGDVHAGIHGSAALGGPYVDPQQLRNQSEFRRGLQYGDGLPSRLAGPVSEADDPYGDSTSPDGLAPVCHVQEIRILQAKDYGAVKRAVFLYGGVQTSAATFRAENRGGRRKCLL